MPRKYHKNPLKAQQIAKARIRLLFQQAKESFKNDSNSSDRYVRLARRISMKHKVKLPSRLKRKFCKNCHKYIVPGVNCRVRLHKHRIIHYCFSCKHYTRYPVK